MWTDYLTERLRTEKLIAVLIVDNLKRAVQASEALIRGGIQAFEVTLRSKNSLSILEQLVKDFPQAIVGAGTVLNVEDCKKSADRGASFAVAPGLNCEVLSAAQKIGLPFAPGIATPSEIEHGIAYGCRVFKVFPAEALGGRAYLESIYSAYRHLGLKFIPLGGLGVGNMQDWLASPAVLALGGSWVAPQMLIEQEDWAGIERRASEARSLCNTAGNQE